MTKKDIIYLSTSIISIGIIILWIFLGYNGKNINSLFSKSNNIQTIKKSNHLDSTNQKNNIINIVVLNSIDTGLVNYRSSWRQNF